MTGLRKSPYDSPRLGKRKRALWGHNPPRNTQAFADAMGRGVRADTMSGRASRPLPMRFRSKVGLSPGVPCSGFKHPASFPSERISRRRCHASKNPGGLGGRAPKDITRAAKPQPQIRGSREPLTAPAGVSITPHRSPRKSPVHFQNRFENRPEKSGRWLGNARLFRVQNRNGRAESVKKTDSINL